MDTGAAARASKARHMNDRIEWIMLEVLIDKKLFKPLLAVKVAAELMIN